MCCRRPIILTSIVAAAALSLLGAGCGGGGGSPGVANIAATTTTTTTGTTTTTTTPSGSGSADKSSGGAGGGPHAQFRLAMNVGTKYGARFSACMRKHGITNFPDPNGQGVITFDSGTGIDPRSPAFESAQSVCQKLLPNGGQPTPAQRAQRQQQLLAFSVCMRAHGIKDFPDPSGDSLRIQSGPHGDLDPSNSTFQKAEQACQKYLPFKASRTGKSADG